MTGNRFTTPQVSQFQQQNLLNPPTFPDKPTSSQKSLQSQKQEDQLSEVFSEDLNNDNNNESKKDCMINNEINLNSEDQDVNLQNKEKNISNNSGFAIKQTTQNHKLSKLVLYCSLHKGDILGIDLLPFYELFDNINYSEHCNTRLNYNALRGNIENISVSKGQFKNEKISFAGSLILDFEGRKCNEKQIHKTIYNNIKFYKSAAHKDTLTSLKMINLKENYLITSSLDCFLKVWNKDTGELKANLNINHPLPLEWNIEKDIMNEGKKKIIFALKILDVIVKKYSKDLTYAEQRNIKVTDFLQRLLSLGISSSQFSAIQIDKKQDIGEQLKQTPMIDWLSKLVDPSEYKGDVVLMKDEYQPRDLQYEKTKKIFQSEVAGPSLKRMELNKKIAIAKKAWKQQNESKEAEIENQLKNEVNPNKKADETDELIYFLEQNYREKLLGDEYQRMQEEFSKKTLGLQRKLDLSIVQKRHQSQLQIQYGQNYDFQRRRQTRQLSNITQIQDTLKTQQLISQQKINTQTDKQTSMIFEDKEDESIIPNALFSRRRKEGSFILPKKLIKNNNDKKNKNLSQQYEKKVKTINPSSDFYSYAIQKQLLDENGNSFNQSLNNIYHMKRSSLPNLVGNSFNISITNQSHISHKNQNDSIVGDINLHEESTIQDQTHQVNASIAKNNSTTIGPNSTLLNSSQSDMNITQMAKSKKENSHKMIKLSHVQQNMDKKIKKAQQNFNDDTIISQFLQKRKELSLISSPNKSFASKNENNLIKSKFIDKQYSISHHQPTDLSVIHSNQVHFETRENLKEHVPYYKPSQKNQSNILTQNGLDVLKKVLYQDTIGDKPYLLNQFGSTKSSRSQTIINQSTPQLFKYSINEKPYSYQQTNKSKAPPIKLSKDDESDDILTKISQSMNQKSIMSQKIYQLKKNLNSNIKNVFDLYRHIEDSLEEQTPANVVAQQFKIQQNNNNQN